MRPRFEPLEDLDLGNKEENFNNLSSNLLDLNGSLDDLDLNQQLYKNYATAVNYLEEIKLSDDIPANQVSQVMNTITSILKEIVKMQTDLYNTERIKQIESAIVKAIKLAPKEAQESFFEEYEKILGEK